MFTAQEILAQLDENAERYTFPMLDNGYVYLAGTNMSAYRDNSRWAIIIEVIGFNYRGGGHNGINNSLYIFGNCLNFNPGLENENIIYLTENSEDGGTFDDEDEYYLNPQTPSFLLRNKKLPLIHSRKTYEEAGILLSDPDKINAYEFLRLLDKSYHSELIATKEEIRKRIPYDIPEFITLQEWYHPDLVANDIPSKNETFLLLAMAMEKGDASLYKPTYAPTTHWKNWPDGGTL